MKGNSLGKTLCDLNTFSYSTNCRVGAVLLQPSHPICHMHLGITLPALDMSLYIHLGNTIVLTASTQKNSIESLLWQDPASKDLSLSSEWETSHQGVDTDEPVPLFADSNHNKSHQECSQDSYEALFWDRNSISASFVKNALRPPAKTSDKLTLETWDHLSSLRMKASKDRGKNHWGLAMACHGHGKRLLASPSPGLQDPWRLKSDHLRPSHSIASSSGIFLLNLIDLTTVTQQSIAIIHFLTPDMNFFANLTDCESDDMF